MALPLYPQLKKSLENMFLELLEGASRQELGPFNESPRFIQHEGTTHSYNTAEGEERQTEYQDMMVELQLSSSELANMTLGDAVKLVVEKGHEIGAQQARYHFGMLSKIIEEAGSTVNGPLTLNRLFEVLEKLYIHFDDLGNPRWPTMVVHPNVTPRLRELARELEAEEAKTRLSNIIERKREEWNEEQDRRKLVD